MADILRIARARGVAVVEDAAVRPSCVATRRQGPWARSGIAASLLRRTRASPPARAAPSSPTTMRFTSRLRGAEGPGPSSDRDRRRRSPSGLRAELRRRTCSPPSASRSFARLDERLERQRRIHAAYAEALAGPRGGRASRVRPRRRRMSVWTDAVVERRGETISTGTSTSATWDWGRFWQPIHRQPPYRASDDARS